MHPKKLAAALFATGACLPGLALATNGMIMEGYGPITAGMGGAALANNRATLALMADGRRIDTMVGIGLAWQASEGLMVAADLKDLLWSDSMNTVTICQNGIVAAPFRQDRENQIVVALCLAWKFNDALTGHIGYNHGKNPVPDEFVNYLWPATAEHHYTAGFGFAFDRQAQVNFSLIHVPGNSLAAAARTIPAW